jgi:hypothetical protein
VRAVLLDGGHGQQGDRALGVDTAEFGRREVLPVPASQLVSPCFVVCRPSCRVAGSGVNLG